MKFFEKWFQKEDIETLQGVNRFKEESSDCSVRALANACGIRYIESHRIHEIMGRKYGNVTRLETCVDIYMQYGFNIIVRDKIAKKMSIGERKLKTSFMFGKRKIQTFIRNHQTGSYIIIIGNRKWKGNMGHALALVNGVLIDRANKIDPTCEIMLIAKKA